MSLFNELKRRNVFRVGLAYLVLAWVLLQVGDVLFEALRLDDSANTLLLAILVIGFVPALIFAWVFELTPDGIKRDSGEDSTTAVEAAKKLDIAVIVLVLVGTGLLAADRFWDRGDVDAPVAAGPPATEPALETVGNSGDQSPASGKQGFIAVLPFANMSANPENEFFADGVTEEILNRLAQVPELNVIARTSSFAFKGDNRDVREIGRTLGAENVLEGSVRRQGDRARITAQLIATDDGAHLWSDTFDRQLDDIFAVQDEIAEEVARALDVVLDEDARVAMANAGIRDVEAFVAYQRGRKLALDAHNSQDTVEGMADAVVEFDRAIERVPGFAAAYLEKSDYYAHLILDPDIEDERRLQALADIRDLLDRAHDMARDPARKAWIDLDRTVFLDDWSTLPAATRKALTVPGCVQGNWLEIVFPFGFEEEIVAHQQHMTECDPLFLFPYANLANFSLRAGKPEEAIRHIEAGEAVGGRHRWLTGARVDVAKSRGDWQQLLDELPDSDSLSLRDVLRRVPVLAGMGQLEEARELLSRTDPSENEAPISPGARIATYAALGDREAANQAASHLDARPGGPLELIRTINRCHCGAPFDLSATPNLAERIEEAGFHWPPPKVVDYPAKDW